MENKYTKNLRQTIIWITSSQEAQEVPRLIDLFILPFFTSLQRTGDALTGKRGKKYSKDLSQAIICKTVIQEARDLICLF